MSTDFDQHWGAASRCCGWSRARSHRGRWHWEPATVTRNVPRRIKNTRLQQLGPYGVQGIHATHLHFQAVRVAAAAQQRAHQPPRRHAPRAHVQRLHQRAQQALQLHTATPTQRAQWALWSEASACFYYYLGDMDRGRVPNTCLREPRGRPSSLFRYTAHMQCSVRTSRRLDSFGETSPGYPWGR